MCSKYTTVRTWDNKQPTHNFTLMPCLKPLFGHILQEIQQKIGIFGFIWVTSRNIKNTTFRKWQAKLAQRKSRHPGATFNRGPDQHLRGNAIANTQGIPEDQPPAFSTNRR